MSYYFKICSSLLAMLLFLPPAPLFAMLLCGHPKALLEDASPLNWPQDVTYIRTCLDDALRYAGEPLEDDALQKVEIRVIPKGHAAYVSRKSRGLFCVKPIKKGEIIAEYSGRLCSHDEKSKKSRYLLKLGNNLYIDAKKFGNEARFINDYRNIATKANVEFAKGSYSPFSYKSIPSNHKAVVRALKDIENDEEILIDYGEGYCKKWGILSANQ